MYGLIIENVLGYLRANFHPKMVEDIIQAAKLPFERAEIDKVYPEGYIPKIGKKASLLLSTPEQDIFEGKHNSKMKKTKSKQNHSYFRPKVGIWGFSISTRKGIECPLYLFMSGHFQS